MTAAIIRPRDRLSFTLFLALSLHAAVILGLGFSWQLQSGKSSTIDITLSQFDDQKTAQETDFLAQTNQLGSGEEAEAIETTTTQETNLPDNQISEQTTPPPEQMTALTEEQSTLVTTVAKTDETVGDEDQQEPEDVFQSLDTQNQSLQALAREIASLEARISLEQQNRAKGPRVKRLNSVATKSVDEAAYLNSWRQKVERVGNQNYPDTKLMGEVVMLVIIREDGALSQVRILNSSGHKLLDEAALRIVRQAAPYASFTVEMRKAYDILEVVRTWQFTRSGAQFGN